MPTSYFESRLHQHTNREQRCDKLYSKAMKFDSARITRQYISHSKLQSYIWCLQRFLYCICYLLSFFSIFQIRNNKFEAGSEIKQVQEAVVQNEPHQDTSFHIAMQTKIIISSSHYLGDKIVRHRRFISSDRYLMPKLFSNKFKLTKIQCELLLPGLEYNQKMQK